MSVLSCAMSEDPNIAIGMMRRFSDECLGECIGTDSMAVGSA